MRPTSRRAAASSFWRGYAASLRRIWLGRMVPAAMGVATRRMSTQFLSIRSRVHLAADQRAQLLRDARALEHVEPFRRQIPDARDERVTEDRACGEDMVGEASRVGVLFADAPPGLVHQETVEDVGGLVNGGRDGLCGEWGEAVGDVRVRLDAGFGSVPGVDLPEPRAVGIRPPLVLAPIGVKATRRRARRGPGHGPCSTRKCPSRPRPMPPGRYRRCDSRPCSILRRAWRRSSDRSVPADGQDPSIRPVRTQSRPARAEQSFEPVAFRWIDAQVVLRLTSTTRCAIHAPLCSGRHSAASRSLLLRFALAVARVKLS